MAQINIPSMFDTRHLMDRQSIEDAQTMAASGDPSRNLMTYNTMRSGDIYNQGLMGLAGLLGGAPDPRIAKQQALEEVFKQFGNPQTPEDAVAIADALQAKGLYNEAMKFMNFANEMKANMPKPKEFSAIEGYKKAKDEGYDKGFMQYQLDLKNAGKDSNVQFGSIPAGYELFQNPQGGYEMRVVKGGPADKEQIELNEKEIREKVRKQMKGNLVIKNIDLAISNINNPDSILGIDIGVVGWGSLLKDVPGTQAKGVAGMISTIKANIGFAELNDMRQASPTGGALGQVSNKEIDFLQAVLGNLDQAQSKEDVLRVLGDVKYWYNYIVHGPTFQQIPDDDIDPAEVG
jgi:hypothetical protein